MANSASSARWRDSSLVLGASTRLASGGANAGAFQAAASRTAARLIAGSRSSNSFSKASAATVGIDFARLGRGDQAVERLAPNIGAKTVGLYGFLIDEAEIFRIATLADQVHDARHALRLADARSSADAPSARHHSGHRRRTGDKDHSR